VRVAAEYINLETVMNTKGTWNKKQIRLPIISLRSRNLGGAHKKQAIKETRKQTYVQC